MSLVSLFRHVSDVDLAINRRYHKIITLRLLLGTQPPKSTLLLVAVTERELLTIDPVVAITQTPDVYPAAVLPKCVSRFDGFLDDVECNGFGPRVSDWFRQVNKQRSCTNFAFRETMFGSTKGTANCCHTAESPLGRVDMDD